MIKRFVIAIVCLLIFGFWNSAGFAAMSENSDLIPRDIPKEKVVEVKKIGSIVWIVFIDKNGASVNYFYNSFGVENEQPQLADHDPNNDVRLLGEETQYFYESGEEMKESDREPLGSLQQKLASPIYFDNVGSYRTGTAVDFSEFVLAFQEATKEKYWRTRFVYFTDGSSEQVPCYGETMDGVLLTDAFWAFAESSPDKAYDLAIDWIEFTIGQKNLFALRPKFYQICAIQKRLSEKKEELINWLKDLLVRPWASEEAKIKSEDTIREVINDLKKRSDGSD